MSVAAKVNEALKRGEIPPEFMEENRLLPTSHPASQKFSATMERVHERLMKGLLGDKYNKAEHAVQFMLASDESPNAFIATGAKPPVIAFSSGIVNLCENESELAAVLCHELGHDYFKKMLGSHDNGKLEELGSDLRGPYMLRKANYPQDAMRRVIEKLPGDDLPEFLHAGSDHPTKSTRISALQTAERALVRGKFGMGEQSGIVNSKVESSLKQAANSASFTSFIDQLLTKHGYDAAPIERKMAILGDVIKTDLAGGDPYFESRIKDVSKKIAALPINTGQASHKQAVDALLETIMADAGGQGQNFYKALQTACKVKGKSYELKPIAGLADVDDAIKRFTEATKPDEIKAAASRLNKLAGRYPFGEKSSWENALIDNIEFNKFALPDKTAIEAASHANPVAPTWDKHVRVALESGDKGVAEALKRLGVDEHDARLNPLLADVSANTIHGSKISPAVRFINLSGEGGRSGRHNVHFNEQGQIIGYRDMGKSALYADEVALKTTQLAERTLAEKAVLKKVDWSQLEKSPKDFWAFVSEHDEHLTPPSAIVGGEHPFAEAFVKKCQELIKKDPDTYRPLVAGYFTGKGDIHHRVPTLSRELDRASPGRGDKDYSRERNRSTSGNIGTKELTVHERGLGVAADHPFVKFVLDDPEQLFAAKDKAALLSHTRYFDMNPLNADAPVAKRWLVDNARVIEGTPCKSLPELEAWVSKVKASDPHHLHGGFVSDLIQFETLRTLDHVKAPASLAELHFIRELAGFNPDSETGIASALRDQVGKVTAEYAKTLKPAGSLPELLGEFKMLAAERTGSTYFPPVFTEQPHLRDQYQQAIQRAVEEIKDPAQAAQALETLLFRGDVPTAHADFLGKMAPQSESWLRKTKYAPYKYDGALADPDFKEWAAKKYTTNVAKTLGADDGSAAYSAKFKTAVDRIATEAPASNAASVLTKLSSKECGNQLLYQEEQAAYLKATFEKMGVKEVVKHNFHAAVGETALSTLGKNYSTREATIEFLTKPFSRDNAAQLIQKAVKALDEKDREKLLSNSLSEEAKIEQMALLHKNFWGLPFEGRILATKQILFDASHHSDKAQAVEDGVKLVLGKVMPIPEGGKATGEVKDGRNVVESYLEATKNLEDKRLITSAMLVANEPNGATAGEKLSVGKGLNLVLGAIDPAGDKVKQAIESHTDTPAHIKAEFKDSKTMAKDPPRHEVLKWVEESNASLPEDQKIKMGKVLGAGSYGITVEGIRADGSKVARTMLYPHVREKAVNEFGILTDATGYLIEKDKKFAPLKDMVRQAQRMSHVETDMEVAAEQGKIAGQLYNDAKVTVDGKTYTFSSAKYIGHGANHKDFEIIHGDHFNDLAHAAKTPEELAHVKGLAKAQVTMELSHLLGGKPFDHDVHGGQQKIVGMNVGRFDNGAMSLTAMSAREKQMIGHVMGGTIKQHYVKGVPVGEALSKEMKRVATNETERDFLATVERGLLATGDFRSHMKEEELGSIIAALFANGKVDADIKKAMEERLSGISGKVFSELEKRGKESGIAIESAEHHTFTASKDNSPLRSPPKESLLEKIPLKNEHIQAGGGAAVGFAGFGMMLHANHRIDQKKEKGEEITRMDRVEQVGGAALGIAGTAAAVDGLAFKSKAAKAIGKFTSQLLGGQKPEVLETAFESLNNAEGKFKFKGASIALGAVVVGGTILHLVSKHWKNKATDNAEDMAWADKVKQPPSRDQQQTAMR